MKDMGHNPRFTNLYIKNFGEDMTDDALGELFSEHGKIVSAVVMKNSGKSMGYGFVSFEAHLSAQAVSLSPQKRVAVCCCYISTVLM